MHFHFQKFTLTSQCACPDVCKGSSSSGSKSGGGSDPGVVGIILLSVYVVAAMQPYIVYIMVVHTT